MKVKKKYDYKNIHLTHFEGNGKYPSVNLQKGYRPKGQDKWINSEIRFYPNDMMIIRRLIDEFIKDNPDLLNVDNDVDNKDTLKK